MSEENKKLFLIQKKTTKNSEWIDLCKLKFADQQEADQTTATYTRLIKKEYKAILIKE